MKLHLPKMLLVAVLAAISLPTQAAETYPVISQSGENTYINVGHATQVNAENKVILPADALTNGTLKVGNGDLVGLFNGEPSADTFVKKYYSGVASTDEHLQSISNSLTVNGDVEISGSGQIYLGGKSGKNHYSNLTANHVTITADATGTSSSTDPQNASNLNLRADSAKLKTLTVNGGAVHLRTFLDSGDQTYGPGLGGSWKSVGISEGLYVNGGYVLIGRQGNGTTQDKGNRSQTNSHFMSSINGEIKQSGGTLVLQGKTYIGASTIEQTGGKMQLAYDSTPAYDYLRFGSSTTTITQNATDSSTNLHIEGQIIYGFSGTSNMQLNIVQKGVGTISLDNGVKFKTKDTSTASNIIQSGDGTINLKGNYTSALFNFSQSGNGTINLASSAAVNANSVTVGAGATLNVQGTLTAKEVTLSSGAILDNNGVISVGSGTAGTTAGSLTVTTGGTLYTILDGTSAALNIGAASSSNTITEWTMGSGSTFGVGFTADYFDSLTMTETNGVKQVSFADVLIATVASGSSVATDSFDCSFVAGDIAGSAGEHWTLKDVEWGNDADGNVLLSGVLVYNPWVTLDQGGEEARDFTSSTEYETGLKITDKDVTLSGDNTHTLGTEVDGVKVTLGHENALGNGPVSTSGESTLKTSNGITAELPDEIQNSGTLTMEGSFKVDFETTEVEQPAAYISLEGNETPDGNGFYREEGGTAHLIVNNDADGDNTPEGTLIVKDGTTVEIDGVQYELSEDGLAGKTGPDYGTYFIRTEGEGSAVKSSEILDAAGITDVTVEMTEASGELTADSAIDVEATAGTLKTTESGVVSGSLTDTTIAAAGGSIEATISGDSTVTVSGTAVTSISGNNTYSGGTEIDGGVLEIGAVDSLGSGVVALKNGGTLDLKGFAVTNKIEVTGCTLTGAGAFAGDLDVASELILTDATTAHKLTMREAGTIKGGSLTVDNIDVLTDSDAIITGNLTLNENGAITLNNGKALLVEGSLTLNGIATIKLEGEYGAGSTLISALDGIEAGEVKLDCADENVMLEKVGNSLVLSLKFNQAVAAPLGQSNWGIATTSRAFVDAVHGQRNNSACLADGRGTVWFTLLGAKNNMDAADISVNGFALGADMKLRTKHTLGLALGYAEGDVTPNGLSQVEQEGAYLATYGEHLLKTTANKDTVSLDWTLAYGSTESKHAGMSWEQDSLQINARVTRRHEVTKRFAVNGFAGMEYFATESDTVNGAKSGSLQNLRGEIGVGASYVVWGVPPMTDKNSGSILGGGCERFVVYGEATYFNDLVRNNPVVRMNGVSNGIQNPGRNGVEIRVGGTYRFNNKWSASANYGFSAMEGSTEHSLNVGASWSF